MTNDLDDIPPPGKDYILQVRVKNGPLLRAIRMRGFKSIAAFAEACGVNYQSVLHYLSLLRAPMKKSGEWTPSALKMGHTLKLPPIALFPEQHLERCLARASGEMEISKEEVARIMALDAPHDDPEQIIQRRQISEKLTQLMSERLDPREERVIRQRFGMTDEVKTLDELGQDFGVGKERIRQIEMKALRKLRAPSSVRELAKVGDPLAEESNERWRSRNSPSPPRHYAKRLALEQAAAEKAAQEAVAAAEKARKARALNEKAAEARRLENLAQMDEDAENDRLWLELEKSWPRVPPSGIHRKD